MTSGYARNDLSRITTGPEWHAECEKRACQTIISAPFGKAKALRIARKHAAQTGHDVILFAETVQRVSAPNRIKQEIAR